jgi:hypothetical protein
LDALEEQYHNWNCTLLNQLRTTKSKHVSRLKIEPLFQPGLAQQGDVEFMHPITQHLGKEAQVYNHYKAFMKNGVKVAVGKFVVLADTDQKEEDLPSMTVEDFRYFLVINIYASDTDAWVVGHEYMPGAVLRSVYNINTVYTMGDVHRSSEYVNNNSASMSAPISDRQEDYSNCELFASCEYVFVEIPQLSGVVTVYDTPGPGMHCMHRWVDLQSSTVFGARPLNKHWLPIWQQRQVYKYAYTVHQRNRKISGPFYDDPASGMSHVTA